jgi:hypothetical protein
VSAQSFDDLARVDIYVIPLTAACDRLKKTNEERSKDGRPQLSIKEADRNLLEDDLVEMVSAGLIPAILKCRELAGRKYNFRDMTDMYVPRESGIRYGHCCGIEAQWLLTAVSQGLV